MSIFNAVLEKEKLILEQTYDSTATIKRRKKDKKINGKTQHITEIICENKKCAIIRDSKSQNNQTVSTNKIAYNELLMINSDISIKQGDEVIVTLPNKEIVSFNAGTPKWFASHQEVILLREDEA